MKDVRYVHQHFDRPAKFGWFTPFEWLLCAVAATVTALWWRYVSPFGFSGTATGAIVLNTPLYVSARLGDGRGGRRLRVRARIAMCAWTRASIGRAGRSSAARGYRITSAPSVAPHAPERHGARQPDDFSQLWR